MTTTVMPSLPPYAYASFYAHQRLCLQSPAIAPLLSSNSATSSARHLQHSISEKLDLQRQIQLTFDIRQLDLAYDPTHPRFTATYLSHCGDAYWLSSVLTDITVPNRLMEIATHR